MKHCLAMIISSFLLPLNICANTPSFAFAGYFGANDTIVKLQDLTIEGTQYELGHKYSTQFFIAGAYLTDDGYVVQKKGEYIQYIALDEAKIHELQQSGDLPSPMPAYTIPTSAYVIGYSLWPLLGFVVFWSIGIPVIRSRIRHARGIRDCPSCGLQLTPEEIEAKFCRSCSTPL